MIIIGCSIQCKCSADSIEISVDEHKVSISMGGKDFPNPCRYAKCPVGKECTVEYSPKLLKVPVAHCASPTTKSKNGDS